MMLDLLRVLLRRLGLRRRRAPLLGGLDIGAGSRVSPANLDGNLPDLIHIGRNCLFAPTAMVLAHDASYYAFNGELRVAPVRIGDNVFLGYGAIVMPGITIGSNVVIGAGSVVTRDVPSNSVVAGVPGRVICSLDEYLARRRREQSIVPPYVGKPPGEINSEDVQRLRTLVLRQLGPDSRRSSNAVAG